MQKNWHDKEPIYRQLHDQIIEMMLEGVFQDGDGLPSIRQLAHELRINPVTVSKTMQLLVADELIEKRRGLGMFVSSGACKKLAELEKHRFLNEEWPQIQARIKRLGITPKQLLQEAP